MEKMKRRRIRVGRVIGLLFACLLAIVLLFGGAKVIMSLFHKEIIASEYANVKETNKLEDDKMINEVFKETDKETKEEFIYAIHLPDLDEKANTFIKDFVEGIKSEKAKVTHIDYESMNAFNQYKSYIITATTYSEMDGLNPLNQVSQKKYYVNYDQEKMITLDDCIRGKAIDILSVENKCKTEQLQLVKINESGITIDANGKLIDYKYDENKTSFVMNNPKIPSILKYPKIDVEKRELDPNKPMVAFTFDDGPAPGNTEKILKALKKVNGRATFFELGSLMEVYPDTVRAVCESGSEVANHSYDHPWLTQLPLKDAKKQIQTTNDIYFSLTGNEIKLIRPPFGDMNKSVASNFSEEMVFWDVDTRDWESRSTEQIIKVAKQYIYDGAIVLFHDIHATTIPAVEQLIQYYDSLGYQFVTVSELLEAN